MKAVDLILFRDIFSMSGRNTMCLVRRNVSEIDVRAILTGLERGRVARTHSMSCDGKKSRSASYVAHPRYESGKPSPDKPLATVCKSLMILFGIGRPVYAAGRLLC